MLHISEKSSWAAFLTNFKLMFDSSPVFWFCSIIGTTLFAVQFFLSLLGSADDFDSFSDVSNFKWLSKQALTGFLMMFGWTGVTCKEEFALSNSLAVPLSLAAGLLTLFLTAYLFNTAKKLQSPGSIFNLDDAVGKEASVYQRIPNGGVGKITIALNQQTFEIDAASFDRKEISSFARVQVIKKLDDNTVVVVEV